MRTLPRVPLKLMSDDELNDVVLEVAREKSRREKEVKRKEVERANMDRAPCILHMCTTMGCINMHGDCGHRPMTKEELMEAKKK